MIFYLESLRLTKCIGAHQHQPYHHYQHSIEMPLTGDYTWSESNKTVSLTVNLKGVSHKHVDVFVTSTVLKINFKPNLIDINLFDEIDEDASNAIFKDGELHICLAKKVHQLWGQLSFLGSKQQIAVRREKALKLHEDRIQHQREMAATRKVDEERMMLREHMALEEKERQRMDDIKDSEKKKAEDEMFDTFSKLSKSYEGSVGSSGSHGEVTMPPPRKPVHMQFRHTPRLFKTPSRESTKKQEQEFIIKNLSKLRGNALLTTDADVSNIDPVWLNSKGDEFYKRGDFGSAINAYTEALNADSTMTETLSKRAACYLHLRKPDKVVEDCSKALKNLNESSEAENSTRKEKLVLRKKLLMMLGMANCLKTDNEKALKNFTSVLQIDKDDSVAQQAITYLKTHTKVSKWKKEGDINFSEGNIDKAKGNYTSALTIDSRHVQCIMNRAACHLASREYADCIADCTVGLEIISSQGKQKSNSSTCALATVLSPTTSTKRKWQAILLCRRAAAKQLVEDLDGALDDLKQAESTVRNNDGIDVKSIDNDIIELKAKINSSSDTSSSQVSAP